MSLKVCPIVGCPTLVKSGRCAQHQQTTSERGYDKQHQAERAQWAPLVTAGLIDCRRGRQCLAPELRIKPDEAWDLGHPDAACAAPKAPEHRHCNRATSTHSTAPQGAPEGA